MAPQAPGTCGAADKVAKMSETSPFVPAVRPISMEGAQGRANYVGSFDPQEKWNGTHRVT